jgi:hypothetical protein
VAFGRAASRAGGGTSLPAVEDLLRSLVFACTTAISAVLAESPLFPRDDSWCDGEEGENLAPQVEAIAEAVRACMLDF